MIFKGVIIVAGIAFGVLIAAILFSGYLEDLQEIDGQEQNDEIKVMNTIKQIIQTYSPIFLYDGISDTLEFEMTYAN